MALLNTPQSIGPNSLEMLPDWEQQFEDWSAGEMLVSGEIARAEYQCPITGEQFQEFGPVVQADATQALELTRQNLAAQGAAAPVPGPYISDAEILDAPQVGALGRNGSGSVYTQTQIDAANNKPTDWTAQRVFSANRPRKRPRVVANVQEPIPAAGLVPTSPWGGAPASRAGWCGGLASASPVGKALLFGGLGLILAGWLDSR